MLKRSILLLLCGLPLLAAVAAENPARARLDAFASGLVGLKGDFRQISYSPDGEAEEESHGTLALQAPRQFRWQYADPYPQLIVADGDNVWIHDQDLDQVSVRAQSAEEAQSPLTVLIDRGLLERDYVVSAAPDRDGLQWLQLGSRASEPSFKQVQIGFDARAPVRMLMIDLLDNRTEWRFSHWQKNPRFEQKLFRFTPPKGVDVVGTPVAAKAAVFPIRD